MWLFLDTSKPLVGASPHGIMECECHEKVCVEIKCPYSIGHMSPLDENAHLTYLEQSEKGLQMKKSHGYYTQRQLQIEVEKVFIFCGYIPWLFTK